ncbi:MAG TPA: insulinase family protein, partial [Candidatus Dorea intestinavium]|nr:insulinase family protein [Candidatus Dorea intestinavium]
SQIKTGYFEKLIQQYLLDNTHGALINVVPEKGRTNRLDQELQEKLAAYKATLSSEEIKKLVADTKALEHYQTEPEKEEDLAKIPVLKREDIKKEAEPIINEEITISDVPVYFHELETNGIGYLRCLFKIPSISSDKLVYLGLLQGMLGLVDTKNYTYGELSNEINLHTGGVGTDLDLYVDVTNPFGEFLKTFELKTKALYENLSFSFAMMEEIIKNSKLHDEKRMKEIISMTISRLYMRFQQAGHMTAVQRASSYSSKAAAYREKIAGIDYYYELIELRDHFAEKKEEIITNLKMLTNYIFRKENLLVSYSAAKEGKEQITKPLQEFVTKLYQEPVVMMKNDLLPTKKNEGFKSASKVQYVAQCGNFIKAGEEYTGALQILRIILSYDYLWKNLRVKGGAYGCMSGFNRIGSGYFTSYRDPHLKATLETYKGISDYVKNFEATNEELTKYIIGTMSGIDHTMNPSTKGNRSMNLLLGKVTYEMLQKERNEILNAQTKDIRNLYKIVDAILAAKQITVVGSEEKINEHKDVFEEIRGF